MGGDAGKVTVCLASHWPRVTDITRLRNDLYCVEWDVKLYYNVMVM